MFPIFASISPAQPVKCVKNANNSFFSSCRSRFLKKLIYEQHFAQYPIQKSFCYPIIQKSFCYPIIQKSISVTDRHGLGPREKLECEQNGLMMQAFSIEPRYGHFVYHGQFAGNNTLRLYWNSLLDDIRQ